MFNSAYRQPSPMAMPASPRIIAITGSPGVGKTTLCNSLSDVTTVEELASRMGALGTMCSDGAKEVDLEMMIKQWPEKVAKFIDGHLSHHLPVDAIVILRCNPVELERRLNERGYSQNKVRANVEYEMLGGPWQDLLEDERPIIELDNSSFAANLVSWLNEDCPNRSTPDSAIDWLSQL